MLLAGFLIAFLSYLLFIVGVAGFFYKKVVLFVLFIWVLVSLAVLFPKFKTIRYKTAVKTFTGNPFLYLLIIQILINFIGVLGPELSFDALWYHLTIPGIYLHLHRIIYIPGNLLYYSAMPKLIEVIFATGLALGSEIFSKIIHFIFGLLSLLIIYKISRRKFSSKMSIIACVIFYSNLAVGWESITAFVDLARVFFELLAVFSILNLSKTKEMKWVASAGLMIGFAAATKLLSVVSVFLLLILINYIVIKDFKNIKNIFFSNAIFLTSVFIVLFPWLLFSYLNTGNPFFPLMSNLLKTIPINLGVVSFMGYIWNLFLLSNDPISPIYIITLPLIPFLFKKLNVESKILLIYSVGGIILSYLIPYNDTARYTLPYLAALSVFQLYVLDIYKGKFTGKVVIGLVLVFSLLSISYRAAANVKFIPVILGIEPKNEFLSKNLNFSFGDFYDVDGNIQKIVEKNKVLIYGVHNLFYTDFDYVHESWVKPGDRVDYVLVQNGEIPKKFSNSKIVYENALTHVKLYSNKKGAWTY